MTLESVYPESTCAALERSCQVFFSACPVLPISSVLGIRDGDSYVLISVYCSRIQADNTVWFPVSSNNPKRWIAPMYIWKTLISSISFRWRNPRKRLGAEMGAGSTLYRLSTGPRRHSPTWLLISRTWNCSTSGQKHPAQWLLLPVVTGGHR